MRRRWQLAGLVSVLIWSCAEGAGLEEQQCDIVWHRDADGDGFGDDAVTELACEQPGGYIREGGDCDDTTNAVYPGAEEDCAVDRDYNCDGSTGFNDLDMDGVAACNDCDDQDPERYPGAFEACDGIDNDCDELIDDDDLAPNVMCDPVVNAVPSCGGEAGCIYTCEGNFTDANDDLADGCECYPQPDIGVGETCGAAFNLGDLVDGSADSVMITGNIPVAQTDRWYRFNGVDDVDTAGDEYHVDVRFLENPSTAYAITVYRGDCPDGVGELLATDETESFDWHTNFNLTSIGCTDTAPCGEGDCSNVPSDSVNLCNDDTSLFYVKVTRLDGAASCDLYSMQFSNGVY